MSRPLICCGLAALLAACAPSPPVVQPTAGATDEECTLVRGHYTPETTWSTLTYAMAYCAARDGQTEEAFALLEKAATHGFRGAKHVRATPDFAAMRDDARWSRIVVTIDANAATPEPPRIAELKSLYEADQSARRTRPNSQAAWDALNAADATRLARVAEIVAAGGLQHTDDYYHAAMVFQHGSTPEDFQKAHAYALKSAELDRHGSRSRWLVCATEDRYLQSIGKPQIWGTQYREDEKDGWTQEPFDRTQRSDAERHANGVPSLAESEAKLEEHRANAAR